MKNIEKIEKIATHIYDNKKNALGKLLTERDMLKRQIKINATIGVYDTGISYTAEYINKLRQIDRLHEIDKLISFVRNDVRRALVRLKLIEKTQSESKHKRKKGNFS